jgi:hypothetical protein
MNVRWQYIPWLIAVAVFLVCVGNAYDRETGFTGLIHFGGPFADRVVPEVKDMHVVVYEDNYGYDGQFYAQLATDPLLRKADTVAAMDNPSYRGRRVFISALAHGLAFGDAEWSIHVYSLINVLFWLGLAVLLAFMIRDVSLAGFVRWVGCLFSLGVVTSVVLGLLELPALFLSLLALLLFEKGKPAGAGIALSASILSKETFLLSGLALVSREKPWRGAIVLAASLVPLALWLVYLWAIQLPQNTGNSGNFQMPFTGLWFEVSSTIDYIREGKIHNLLALFALLYQAGYLLLHPQRNSLIWRFSIPYMVLAAFLGVAVWESDPGAAYRVLVPVAIAFNLLLRPGGLFMLHWIAGNLSLVISIKYLLRLG